MTEAFLEEFGNVSGSRTVPVTDGRDLAVRLPPPVTTGLAVRWTGPGCPVRLGGGLPLVEREFGRVEAVGRR